MMPHDLILAFDAVAEAPDGMTRLRELVLQLAVRGRLVPQDAADEPASVLLDRIAAEKRELLRAGKFPSQALPHPVTDDEVPFVLPESWCWSRFGVVTETRLGKMLDRAKNRGPLRRYLRNANVQWFRFELEDVRELRIEDDQVSDCSVRAGDLVICEGGEPGRAAVCGPEVDGMVVQKALHRSRPWGGINACFLAYLLRCDASSGRLAEHFTGATIKHLTGKALASFVVPLPPVAEQRRIVARVDELMGLIDRLEAAGTALEATRAAVRDSALDTLREAVTPHDVEAAWNRIAERMADLLRDPADIAPLQQAVLQLAVRGRLVRQDPGDEHASVLLERVAVEKAGLVKAGKVASEKEPRQVSIGELPFEVPAGWSLARLDHFCDIGSGVAKGRKLAGRTVKTFPYLRVANVQAGHLDLNVVKNIEIPPEELSRYRLADGDVLLTEGGDWDKLGRSTVWRDEIPNCIHQNHIFRARSLRPEDILPRWISMFTNSSDGRGYFQACSKQTTNLASINKTQLRWCPVPIPPAAEQRRIVAALDRVGALLDRLEGRLIAEKTLHGAFAAAAVHHIDT